MPTRSLLSEFVGTFAVVFVAAGSVVAVAGALGQVDGGGLVAVALAYGAAFGLMVAAAGGAGRPAHLNPAVTLGALVTGRSTVREAVGALGAQLTGAAAGAAVLRVALPSGYRDPVGLGALEVNPALSSGQGVLLEAVLTAVLVWTALALALPAGGDADGGAARVALGVGVAVAVGVLVAGPFTGGALNPARAFGPALVEGAFTDHWVYWVGPLAGGVVGAVGADLTRPGSHQHHDPPGGIRRWQG